MLIPSNINLPQFKDMCPVSRPVSLCGLDISRSLLPCDFNCFSLAVIGREIPLSQKVWVKPEALAANSENLLKTLKLEVLSWIAEGLWY